MNAKLLAFFAVAAMVATSCNKDEEGGYELQSDIVAEVKSGETLTLEANTVYRLDAGLHVKDGGKLVIEEGVTIMAQYDDVNTDYIFVEQGGYIDAQGTASKPIVMTSTKKEAGAWGGIHICGKAPINTGDSSLSEIESLPYGGTDSADNSGVLKYIRLEYTGYSYSEDQECNGFSFYGVGNGTTVEYCQSYYGSDDGFEFFGGTVNIKYCVATNNSDDSFDWTDGWCGTAQFIVAYQDADATVKCDCLLECDNQGTDNSASPASNPTIANATLIGDTYSDAKTDGVMLKAGTSIQFYNSIVTGKTYDIYYKSDVTIANVEGGDKKTVAAKFDGIYTTTGISKEVSEKNEEQPITGITSSATLVKSTFYNGVAFTVADAAATIPTGLDTANYVGAFDDTDWTIGWTL
ncbi:MAG: hypothetical protein SNJ09_00995 [Rikenellaceae bacterium]